MKVSVVIPAYNEEAVIIPTLEAISAQTHQDLEIIVVNNASTDKTAEVVSAFITRHFSTKKMPANIRIVHETRKGLLWARERGRQEATGEIVANIDADCLPDPEWLSSALKYFDGKTGKKINVVAVSGPYDYYDAKKSFRMASFIMQNYIYRPVSHILQAPFIKRGAVLIGGNNLIRADILKKMGGYNTQLTFYGEDTDTANRVSSFGRIVFMPSVSMKTSARRFKDEGAMKITLIYLYHFFRHILVPKSGKKHTKTH